MRRALQAVLLLCLALPVLALAGPPRKAMRAFEPTHLAWANAMRWGTLEEQLPFVADNGAAGALDELQRRRWEQVRISGYRQRARAAQPDGDMQVRAEISLINVHTQTERTVLVDEQWRWHAEGGWKLVSGLPDLWAKP